MAFLPRDREAIAWELRHDGWTFREIGYLLGVTRQGAAYLVRRYEDFFIRMDIALAKLENSRAA